MAAKEVYWHLPGFCYFRLFYQVLMNMMKDYPDKFRDGYKIGSVYGTFPGAIWNGGRAVFGLAGKNDIDSTLKMYNQRNVPVRFTWTNCLLEDKHVYDTYCNLIMKMADNGLNQVLVNTPVLEEYIRKEYPNYPMISSTTKRITSLEGIKAELEKNYDLVVLDYDLNHNEEVLKELEPVADRIEILVDEVCFPGCTKRAEHYKQQSQMQLEFDVNTGFPCPNHTQKRGFVECMSRPSFISKEEIQSYIDRGYVNFKLVGRGLPLEYVKDSVIYYMVKDEEQEFIRKKIDDLFVQFEQAKRQQRR